MGEDVLDGVCLSVIDGSLFLSEGETALLIGICFFAGPLVLSAPHCVRGDLVVFYAVPFDYPLLELSNFLEPFDRLARAQVLS